MLLHFFSALGLLQVYWKYSIFMNINLKLDWTKH